MNWFRKKPAADAKPKPENDALHNATVAVVNILMRNAGEMDKCWADLEQTGLSRESISLICNLTVFACSQDVLRAILPKNQIPEGFIFVDQSGAQQAVRFEDSDIYRTAQAIIRDYGPTAVRVGESSNQLKAVNMCINMLGGATEENIARIQLSPPSVPAFGYAETLANILPRVGGASLALKRRTEYEKKYFKGKGLDVGEGTIASINTARYWDSTPAEIGT